MSIYISHQRSNETDPFYSHPSKPQLYLDTTNPIILQSRRPSSGGMAPDHLYSCNICGKFYVQRQSLMRHHREAHERRLCLYCDDFKSSPRHKYRSHLKKYHPDVDPDVVLAQGDSTRELCMYCDVEWNHSYQYEVHLRERHPNVDPDAVLGKAPGPLRRDKVIARHYKPPASQLMRARKTALAFRELSRQQREFGDEARRDGWCGVGQ